MRVVLRSSSFLLVLIGCTSHPSFKTINSVPTAEITGPTGASILAQDGTVTFSGVGNDVDGAKDQLTIEWSVDQVTVPASATCPGTAERSVPTACVVSLDAGPRTVVMTVIDALGASGSDSVTLQIENSATPDVAITAPTNGEEFYQFDPIELAGEVGDVETPAVALDVWWTSDQDGALDLSTTPDTNGSVSDWTSDLSVGDHLLTLHALDGHGVEGSASVPITIHPPNTAPHCEINPDLEGSVHTPGDTVSFNGTATDPDIDATELTVFWESSLVTTGFLATSIPDSAGAVSANVQLLAGTHVITMTAEDERGLSCSDSASVKVSFRPVIEMITPVTDDLFADDDLVTIEILVTDDDHDVQDLDLVWTADGQILVAVEHPDNGGQAVYATSDLPAGTYQVQVTAIDPAGLTASASAIIEVNEEPGAPTIHIEPDPPRSEHDLVAFVDGMPTDNDDDAVDLFVTWAWTVDGGPTAFTSDTVPAAQTTRGDVWTAIATGNDPHQAGLSTSASVTIVNGVPEITDVAISPSTPHTNDDLTCEVTAIDSDTDPISLSFRWTVDGIDPGVSDAVLSSSHTAPNATVTCHAFPDDGFDHGPEASASVAVSGNTPPMITAVVLEPAGAVTGDDVVAVAQGWFDNEGDAAQYSYAWTVGGTPVSAPTGTLDDGFHQRGSEVQACVTPTDGALAGPTVCSAVLTIGNTAPIYNTVALTPQTPDAQDILTATLYGWTDEDGDVEGGLYRWSHNGNPVVTQLNLNTLALVGFVKGDEVCVQTDAFDGLDYGSVRSDCVTLGNAPPSLGGVTLTPANPKTSDDLTATPTGWSDMDGDPEDYVFQWSVQGAIIAGAGGDSLSSSLFVRDDVVQVQVRGFDGDTVGQPVQASATIGNSPPIPGTARIEGSLTVEQDLLGTI